MVVYHIYERSTKLKIFQELWLLAVGFTTLALWPQNLKYCILRGDMYPHCLKDAAMISFGKSLMLFLLVFSFMIKLNRSTPFSREISPHFNQKGKAPQRCTWERTIMRGRVHLAEFSVGVCHLVPQILTQFQTKKSIFHTSFQTWPLKSIILTNMFICSRGSLENHTGFKTTMVKIYTHLQTKTLKNHTLWGGTYLYSLYTCRGVPLPLPRDI